MSVQGSGDVRTITMKGDANAEPDPAPYTVSQVRLVMGSVPGLARVIVWFANPLVLGALTIGAAALVTWAFWPRDARDGNGDDDDKDGGDETENDDPDTDAGYDDPDGGDSGSGDGDGGDGDPAAAATQEPTPGAEPGVPGRPPRHAGRTLSLLAVLGIAGALPLAAAAPARAAAPEVSQGRYLTVTNIANTSAMSTLSPGTAVRWQVGIALASAARTRAVVDLSTRGSLDLRVDLQGCTERWVAGSCPGTVIPVASVAGFTGRQHDVVLADVPAGAQRWLLFRVTLPAPAHGTMSATVRASANGESVSAGTGSGSLPNTGVDPWRPLLLAVGAIAVGLTIAGAASRSRRRA
jgi:signal peptidase